MLLTTQSSFIFFYEHNTLWNRQEVGEVDGGAVSWNTFYSMLRNLLSMSRMGVWDLFSCHPKACFLATSAFWLKFRAKPVMISFNLRDSPWIISSSCTLKLPSCVINGCLAQDWYSKYWDLLKLMQTFHMLQHLDISRIVYCSTGQNGELWAKKGHCYWDKQII